ncbi:unnamed protein product [Paramecium octaurelia]|uniref:Uncharacterized protein n=1 Tax=Paramecium octaurelia TaxID=43137 RepID=A0A8S1YSA1_PAROT|nr:unnamed protein product [Paramecium octaurelia]
MDSIVISVQKYNLCIKYLNNIQHPVKVAPLQYLPKSDYDRRGFSKQSVLVNIKVQTFSVFQLLIEVEIENKVAFSRIAILIACSQAEILLIKQQSLLVSKKYLNIGWLQLICRKISRVTYATSQANLQYLTSEPASKQ